MTTTKKTGLDLLRAPFPDNQISKLPKGSKAQNECAASEKVNCRVCGGWHHPKVVHLDYVGHAALTDRLLDADPQWSWEPVALRDGLPALDANGGLWIRLTVCGVTRLGYGDAPNKRGGDAVKEAIGDALRNAAMRFGAALDLWHKGDLHADEEPAPTPAATRITAPTEIPDTVAAPADWMKKMEVSIRSAESVAKLDEIRGYINTKRLPQYQLSKLASVCDEIETALAQPA